MEELTCWVGGGRALVNRCNYGSCNQPTAGYFISVHVESVFGLVRIRCAMLRL